MGIVLGFSEGSPNSSLPSGDLSLLKMKIYRLENFPKKDRPLSFKFLTVIQNLGRIVRAERND